MKPKAQSRSASICPWLPLGMIWSKMFYAFFWVIPYRLNFICRRFGTLCLFHLHRRIGTCLWRWDSVPKRRHIKFRRRGITQKKACDIRNTAKVWNQGNVLSPLLFNLAVEFTIRTVQVNQGCLKVNGTHQFLVYADDVNILGGSVRTDCREKENQKL